MGKGYEEIKAAAAKDPRSVAAAAKPKPVNNKKKKHRHGRAQ